MRDRSSRIQHPISRVTNPPLHQPPTINGFLVTSSERRSDLDWLRVGAIVMMLLFHCARFFNDEDWHVKNKQLSEGMGMFVGVVVQWLMPLFFMLSAMAIWYALGFRTNRQYLAERCKRLLIPFVFGTLALIPPQVYIERTTHGQFNGSFLQFYPHYFQGWYGFGGNFAWMGLHLWYLEVLFVFSLLLLPLFRLLRREGAKSVMARLGWLCEKPGAVFLLALPIGCMECLVNLQPGGIGRRDFGGWSPLTYLVFFCLGYLVACDGRCRAAMERHRVVAVILALAALTAGVLLGRSGHSSRAAGFAFLRAFHSWFCLVAMFGFGSRYLSFTNGALKYANEAVMPFYVLHQTVIVGLAYFLISWETGVIVKYAVLLLSAFAVMAAAYELAIRRLLVLRFLFGMKLRK